MKAFTRSRGVAERISHPRQVDIGEEIEVSFACCGGGFDPLRAMTVVMPGVDDGADEVCVEDEEWGVGCREWGVGALGTLTVISHSPLPTPHAPIQSRILERHLSSRDRL